MLRRFIFPILYLLSVTLLVGCNNGSTSTTPPTPLSSTKQITAFSINSHIGVIDQAANTINVTVPFNTDITSLIATFTTTGAMVRVGNAIQTSGQTTNNFSQPLSYTVYAQDGSTRYYQVRVIVAPSTAKEINSFSLSGQQGLVFQSESVIAVSVLYNVDKASLIAEFDTDGESVTINGTPQSSGVTPNDFTSPVVYTVHAADGSSRDYTVYIRPHSAYIINRVLLGSQVLSKCSVTNVGDLTSCTNIGDFGVPDSVVLSNSQNFLYLAQDSQDPILKCKLESNGDVGECSDASAGAGLNVVSNMTFNATGDTMYLINFDRQTSTATLHKCSINQNGDLENCILDNPNSVVTPNSIVIDHVNNLAYVTEGINAQIHKCSINQDGTLNQCANTDQQGQLGLTIDYVHSYLYSSVPFFEVATSCKIDVSGDLTNCDNTSVSNIFALGLNNDSSFIYLVDNDQNSVTKCAVGINGIVSNTCSDSGVGAIFNHPSGIAITY